MLWLTDCDPYREARVAYQSLPNFFPLVDHIHISSENLNLLIMMGFLIFVTVSDMNTSYELCLLILV